MMSKLDVIPRDVLEKIRPYVPGKPQEELKRELGIARSIKIASNENPLGPSKKAAVAVRKAIRKINRYPDPDCFNLRRLLASRLGVGQDSLMASNGSDEIIVLTLRAFVNEGDEVIVAFPTFLIFEIQSIAQGARVVKVPLKNFRYDLSAMLSKISSKTKVIFIANPDNPTGTYVTKTELDAFIEAVPENIIIYLDEAYVEFVDEKDFPQSLEYLARKRNIIITRTFSKIYGLAGLRVGYAVAAPGLIGYLNKVREPFNVNSLAQAAACAALKDKRHVENTKQLIKEQKNILYGTFDSLKLMYVPSATNFILVDTGFDGVTVFNELLKKGVIVRDMKPYMLGTWIRVTIGTLHENRRFIRTFKEVLTVLRGEKQI
ncbi:MAG: histidinol-phosphate transaminase [Candidatus Omnitrophota bacterium]